MPALSGRDFGRSGDLSVDYPLLQEKNPVRRVPFVLELRNAVRPDSRSKSPVSDGWPAWSAGCSV